MNIYKSSIDQNKIYKQQQKIEKAQKKREQMIWRKTQQLQKKRDEYLLKIQEKAQINYQRKLNKYLKEQDKKFEKLKREIEGKKPLKKLEKKQDETKALKKKLYTLIQKYVRLRDSDKHGWGKCISCGKKVRRNKADGGHYISRTNMSTAFDEKNIHLQCKGCNGMLGGNLIEYRKNLIKKIGEDEVLKLEEKKHQTKKRTKEELEKLIDYYAEASGQLQYDKIKI